MTLGTARIDPTLGEVIGPIPCIHETVFKILGTPDPFQEGKLIKETYMLVVFPSHIKRTAGFQTPLDLDSQGNLIKVFADQIQHGKELVISLTPKNIRVLTYYPLSSYPREKDENIVVFNKVGFNEADNNPIFDHCSNISDKTRVYLMRRCVIGKNLPYAEQEELVKKFGFDVTPTCVRMLSNAVEILTSGTCPDNFSSFQTSQAESIFACGPEPVVCVNGENGHPAIGGFIRGKGLYPYYCEDNDAQKFLGVAPCTRADDPFVGKDADVPQVDNADIFYVGD
jgi:hypothetical protein